MFIDKGSTRWGKLSLAGTLSHCTAQCTVHSALCTVHSAMCTVHSALCTVHCAQCTVHSAQNSALSSALHRRPRAKNCQTVPWPSGCGTGNTAGWHWPVFTSLLATRNTALYTVHREHCIVHCSQGTLHCALFTKDTKLHRVLATLLCVMFREYFTTNTVHSS